MAARLAILLDQILAQAADRRAFAELVVQQAPAVVGDDHLEMAAPLEQRRHRPHRVERAAGAGDGDGEGALRAVESLGGIT